MVLKTHYARELVGESLNPAQTCLQNHDLSPIRFLFLVLNIHACGNPSIRILEKQDLTIELPKQWLDLGSSSIHFPLWLRHLSVWLINLYQRLSVSITEIQAGTPLLLLSHSPPFVPRNFPFIFCSCLVYITGIQSICCMIITYTRNHPTTAIYSQ